jgi:2-enoate reductase
MRITTYLEKEVTKEFVKEVNPDVVILATGAIPFVPKIPGVEGNNVFLAIDILEGKKPLGNKSIIIGGGQTGLETADFLAEAGQRVTIVEMLPEVGMDMPLRNKMFLMKKLSEENISIFVNRKVKEITVKGVRVDYSGQQEDIAGDTVIVSVGSRSQRALLEEIEEVILELKGLYFVGDCIAPRTALEAISEAVRIAKEI